MELTKEYFEQQLANLPTKRDLEQFATKEDIDNLGNDVNSLKTDVNEIKTDVVSLQNDIRSVKSTLQEINQTLTNLDKRDKEDSDAFAKTLVQHGERLNSVEQEIKNLKLKQA